MATKRFPLLILIFLGLSVAAWAQNVTPKLLMGPADWRLEYIPIPPPFAPAVKFTGFEEARFAPGMFSTNSANYFTYIVGLSVEGTSEIGAAEIKDFLEKYYKGLSIGVGRRKQLTPDATQMIATVNPSKSGSGEGSHFEATLPFFDTFNDGRKILLNLEIRVIAKPEAKKSLIVLLISPQGPDGEAWKKLREIAGTVKFD